MRVNGEKVTTNPQLSYQAENSLFSKRFSLLSARKSPCSAAKSNLPQPFEAIRYHSLIVERSTLPDELEITAETADGLIMGLRHRTHPVEGVQFHPESIMTSVGKDVLRNFLASRRAAVVHA